MDDPRSTLLRSVRRTLLSRLAMTTAIMAPLAAIAAALALRSQIEAEILRATKFALWETVGDLGREIAAGTEVPAAALHRHCEDHWGRPSRPADLELEVAVALRDATGVVIGTAIHPSLALPAALEEARRNGWGQTSPPSQASWFRSDGVPHVLIHAPIPAHPDEPMGSIDVLFRVSDATAESMRSRTLLGALAAAGIVALTGLVLAPITLHLTRGLIRLTEALLHSHFEGLAVLGDAIAKRDTDTSEHNFRVTIAAVRLAERVGLDRSAIQSLFKGAFLHDVGKIAVPDHILLKPGRLTGEERDQMKLHVAHGMDIIGGSAWLAEGGDVVRCHHERFDGRGYPAGIGGEDIPVAARIFAIADVFDALTSRRPYKEPLSLDEALHLMAKDRGTHFDPALLDTFFTIAPGLHRELSAMDAAAMKAAIVKIARRHFSPSDLEKDWAAA